MTDHTKIETNALGPVPTWDLVDLYSGPEAPELVRDLKEGHKLAKAFEAEHRGQLSSSTGATLSLIVAEYERIDEILGRIMSYASLLHAADMENAEIGQFFQDMREQVTEISTHLLFFTLELNRIEDAELEEKLSAPDLAHYRPWLRDVRVFRPHQLSHEAEKLLHEKRVSGRSAWVRLFDETMASLRFPFDGNDLTSPEVLNLLSDRNERVRQRAAHSLETVLRKNLRLFTHITNTVAKDKEIEDKWRNYQRPVSHRNLANFVEDDLVDTLSAAVQRSYPDLSHRYYALKAKWLGKDKLSTWDRNAPLPDDDTRQIPWNECVDLVLDAYGKFSPEMAALGRRFFDAPWIDAVVRPGKCPGAFAHPTVPSAHPYLLLNYQGKTRDVMTLAHELGHGVHQLLAADQGHLLSDTPLTLAETASVFGEMLTFRRLLNEAPDAQSKRVMLAGKVEDMLNTVVRQISFYEFERQLHDKRCQGELLPDDINAIWLKVQAESLGPAFDFHEEYGVYWTYIPHFIHTPFYVYAYAFGDCLVNSLYAVYETAEDDFAQKYLDMLRAGGTLRHRELLAPFGLDASDPAFWDKGLGVIKHFIDELEALG